MGWARAKGGSILFEIADGMGIFRELLVCGGLIIEQKRARAIAGAGENHVRLGRVPIKRKIAFPVRRAT